MLPPRSRVSASRRTTSGTRGSTAGNAGSVEAEESVQWYLSDLEASVPVPLHKLVGFQRVRLAPGGHRSLEFTIRPEMLAVVDEAGQSRLEPGQFRITVGGCSPGARERTRRT